MFKFIKIFSINVFVFLILIIILEIILGYSLNKDSKLDCHYLLCGRTFNYETDLHGNIKDYQIIYTRDLYGFRDREKELSKVDILAVGGSTTDERYLKNEDTWTNLLQHKLSTYFQKDIDVVNGGIDGQSTFGHIWNFENWYNKLENFNPKYIIFYIGINDVLYKPEKYGSRSFKFNFDNNQDISKLSFINQIKFLLKKNNGIIYKIYVFINSLYISDIYEVAHSNTRNKFDYKIPNKKLKIDQNSKKKFLVNLNSLFEHSKEIGSIPIFVTQKTLRGKRVGKKILSINEFDFYNYEKNISDIIIKFCTEKEILCINSNENFDIKPHESYDLVHLSPEGSINFSNFLFNNLKNKLKF